MAAMSDAERMQLLKEIGGTRVYEERRRESLKLMEESKGRKAQILGMVSSRGGGGRALPGCNLHPQLVLRQASLACKECRVHVCPHSCRRLRRSFANWRRTVKSSPSFRQAHSLEVAPCWCRQHCAAGMRLLCATPRASEAAGGAFGAQVLDRRRRCYEFNLHSKQLAKVQKDIEKVRTEGAVACVSGHADVRMNKRAAGRALLTEWRLTLCPVAV
jgi:hypothetical protein